jgi:ketosteroid isomerase-like protein
MTRLFAALFVALLFYTGTDAAETPETILIRQTLGTDLSGHRRGDADLVLSSYDAYFVSYDAHGSNDPHAWTITLEGRDSFAEQLKTDLQKNRYETERTIPSIQVRADVATATTLDSGQIINRQSGAVRTIYEKRFWTLFKSEDRWRATAVVTELGETAAAAKKGSNDSAISAVLEREKQGREAGDAAAISSLFAEHFSGYRGKNSLNPAAWQLIFNGTEELEKHLAKRLPHVTYRINRQIVQTHVGARGNEAIAITREDVSIQHARGEVQHEMDRYVMWTLSKRDGTWKITNMLYNFGQPD